MIMSILIWKQLFSYKTQILQPRKAMAALTMSRVQAQKSLHLQLIITSLFTTFVLHLAQNLEEIMEEFRSKY